MGFSPQTLAELRSTLDMLDASDLVKFALLAEIDRLHDALDRIAASTTFEEAKTRARVAMGELGAGALLGVASDTPEGQH